MTWGTAKLQQAAQYALLKRRLAPLVVAVVKIAAVFRLVVESWWEVVL